MILIGLGANLPSPEHGPPQATLAAALDALEARGARVLRRSPWYESAPVPPSGQPWYVNAVAEVESRALPAGAARRPSRRRGGFRPRSRRPQRLRVRSISTSWTMAAW